MANNPSSAALKGARWQALTNGHYHAERASFLGWVDRLITFVVLVAGASAVASALNPVAQALSTVSVTIFALFQLVFAIGAAERKHSSLREKYFGVAADIDAGKISADEASARMLVFAGEEGPIYCAAHALSETWAKQAVYGSSASDLCKVGWFRRSTRHVLRHSAHDFHA